MTSPKDQEQYWANTHGPYRYIPVREFSELFKRFTVGVNMQQELHVPFPKEKSHRAALATKTYAVSKKELVKANFKKEWLLYKRNAVVSVFKIAQVLSQILALASSSPLCLNLNSLAFFY